MTDPSSDPRGASGPADSPTYDRPFEPPVRPALIPLLPGAIEPAGWLRDWCLAARDGYTGHTDDYDVAFQQAWAADYRMTGRALFWPEGGWPYEGGGYWFDGLVRLGYALHDTALIRKAAARMGAVVDNMSEHGIGFFWWLDRHDPADLKAAEGRDYADSEWPMWANGLFGRALAAWCAATRNPAAIGALESAYTGSGDWVRLGWGLSNPWPAHEAYTWTGNAEIRKALLALFAQPGEDARPWGWNRYRRPPDTTPGVEASDHGVHFLESTAPWALGYLWTGERAFLDAARAWQAYVETSAMQPHGVIVSDEFYGPTGAFRGTETCDVAAFLWSKLLLLMAGGDGALGDQIERAVFNAGPAAVAADFKTHVYFQAPNRLVGLAASEHGVLPEHERFRYQRTHWPLCCTAALNRIVPYYVTHLWMATPDHGLACVGYGPCCVTARVADGVPVTLECRTDYPFGETVEVEVTPARAARFPLAFRIPQWCAFPSVAVNGTAVAAVPDGRGFVRIERLWAAGDSVRLVFPMAVRVAEGQDRNVDPPAPYATVSYGPLLFALGIPEAGDPNTADPGARWGFALDPRAGTMAVARGPMPTRWDWPLDAPLKVHARAVPFDWQPTPEQPLPPEAVSGEATEAITLVPYGCTTFRVSMFPVRSRGD